MSTAAALLFIFCLSSDEFLQTVKKRLHSLLQIHDGNTFIKSDWVLKEASNIDALQEGGTFRQLQLP